MVVSLPSFSLDGMAWQMPVRYLHILLAKLLCFCFVSCLLLGTVFGHLAGGENRARARARQRDRGQSGGFWQFAQNQNQSQSSFIARDATLMWLQLVNVELAACPRETTQSVVATATHCRLSIDHALFHFPFPSYLPLFAGKYEKHNMEPSSVQPLARPAVIPIDAPLESIFMQTPRPAPPSQTRQSCVAFIVRLALIHNT